MIWIAVNETLTDLIELQTTVDDVSSVGGDTGPHEELLYAFDQFIVSRLKDNGLKER